jgi:preprotein translocase subunit SecA
VCQRLQSSTTERQLVLLIAHFTETHQALARILEQRKQWFLRLEEPFGRSELEQCAAAQTELPIFLALASQLREEGVWKSPVNATLHATIVIAERHLVRSEDERIETFATTLSWPCTLEYHLSLDDPILRAYGGIELRRSLQKLGLTEDAAHQSKAISATIAAAQAKARKEIKSMLPAPSAEEWLRINRGL